MTDADHSFFLPADKREALEELARRYGLEPDQVLDRFETAAVIWHAGQRVAKERTAPEIAAELASLAVHLERLSEEADHAVCVGIGPDRTPYRVGWSRRLAADARAVAEVYGATSRWRKVEEPKADKPSGCYVLYPPSRRNADDHAMGGVIVQLIFAWMFASPEAKIKDRRVRAYRDKQADKVGWSGNRGACFVRDAAELITGRRPSFEAIAGILATLEIT
jgi:hypothetical protein